MAWRTGHGARKGPPRIEVLPADEIPEPVPGVAQRGGATKVKLIRYAVLPDDAIWGVYAKHAEQFRKHHCKELAKMAGGKCGAGPSSIIATAALQLAVSRWMFEEGAKTCDPNLLKQASNIADSSRQNLLAAYELAVKEAHARKAYAKDDPHAALAQALR